MKNKRLLAFVCFTLICVGICVTLWYFAPKTFLRGVDAEDISKISVFDGGTGQRFDITEREEIVRIVDNVSGISMKRGKLSRGYDGFRYSMDFVDESGRVIESFIVNSEDTIRDDPFFWHCEGELCYEYLGELEGKYIPDGEILK